jgi:hypothetical protein
MESVQPEINLIKQNQMPKFQSNLLKGNPIVEAVQYGHDSVPEWLKMFFPQATVQDGEGEQLWIFDIPWGTIPLICKPGDFVSRGPYEDRLYVTPEAEFLKTHTRVHEPDEQQAAPVAAVRQAAENEPGDNVLAQEIYRKMGRPYIDALKAQRFDALGAYLKRSLPDFKYPLVINTHDYKTGDHWYIHPQGKSGETLDIYFNNIGMPAESKTAPANPVAKTAQANQPDTAAEILADLCNLKQYKDRVGADYYYAKTQQELWKRANDFLNSTCKKEQRELLLMQGIGEIISSFGKLWQIKPLPDWPRLVADLPVVEIITPFATTNCKFVSVFITPGSDFYLVSDGGYMDQQVYGDFFDPGNEMFSKLIKHYQDAFHIDYAPRGSSGEMVYHKRVHKTVALASAVLDMASFIAGVVSGAGIDFNKQAGKKEGNYIHVRPS